MTPEKCPNCGTKLRREMLSCPNCPMSFPDDDPASRVHPLKQSKYYQFLLPLVFFSALLYLVFNLGMGLFRLGEQNSDKDISGLMHPDAPAPAPARPTPTAAISDPDGDGTVFISHQEPMEPPPAPLSPMKAVPTAKPAREWRLRGTLYDLVSLQPLPNCTVLLVDQELNRRIETRTDSSGAYRMVVPSLPDRGYTVQLLMDGYSPTYLAPGTSGVRRMPVEKRRALARDLGATFTSEPASLQAPDARPLITDFYLAPRR